MSKSRSFPERAEPVLIIGMILGIALIAQRYSISLFRWGLGILVASTILEIAVGNLPKEASLWRSVILTVVILCIFVIVFALGVWMVPVLSRLGR
jgi:predicted membrane protein